jgi:hypothetical protein
MYCLQPMHELSRDVNVDSFLNHLEAGDRQAIWQSFAYHRSSIHPQEGCILSGLLGVLDTGPSQQMSALAVLNKVYVGSCIRAPHDT